MTIASDVSASSRWLVSTTRAPAPLPTRPAIAAFARPLPIAAATSATVGGAANSRLVPNAQLQTSAGLGLPLGWVYAAVPVGSALIILPMLGQILGALGSLWPKPS